MAKGKGKSNKQSRSPTRRSKAHRGKSPDNNNAAVAPVDARDLPMVEEPATPGPSEKLVIKSPLDTNDYTVIELPNGLKAFLISTIKHEADLGENQINHNTGQFVKVEEFNRRFVNIPNDDEVRRDTPGPGKKDPKSKGKGDKGCQSKKDQDSGDSWEPELKRARVAPTDAQTDEIKKKLPSPVSICLAIEAGHLHDPEDVPGMAHICEHAVASFGSQKYPKDATLFDEARKGRGAMNAITYAENTVYCAYVDLNATGEDGLEKILDILSDAVKNPLLPAERVEREVHAVDCEFGLQECHDANRMWRLLCSSCDPRHPFARFSCGNSVSLNHANLHTRIADWMKRHYAANYMTLTLKAAIPLDRLEQMTKKYFSSIQESALPSPMTELTRDHGNPFLTNAFHRIYKVFPVLDYQFMTVTWTLPSKFEKNFQTKPLEYVASLFGNGSSLMKYFREKHWAYMLHARSTSNAGQSAFCSTFSLMTLLTDTGVTQMREVVKAIFSYLHTLEAAKPQERLFNELQRENADSFHYGGTDGAGHPLLELVEAACQLRKLEDPKYILTSRALMTKFDPRLIQECLKSLTPRNMNLMVCSKSFEKEAKHTEQWYKIKYAASEIPQDLLKQWETAQPIKEFGLPTENSFKQKNMSCPLQEQEMALPTLVLNTKKAKALYFKLNVCNPGKLPTGIYTILIASPTTPSTPIGAGLLQIWTFMMQDTLQQPLEDAKKSRIMAGALAKGGNLIGLGLQGPPGHHNRVLKLVLDTFSNFDKIATESAFEDYKDLLRKSYSNEIVNSENFAEDLHEFVFRQNHSLNDHVRAALEKVNFQDFMSFVSGFKSKMFVQAMMMGCLAKTQATQAAEIIQGMDYREIPEMFHVPESRAMQLPLGERCIRVKSRNLLDQNSRVVNHYQFGNLSKEENELIPKIVHLLSTPAFVQLRNMENLSYVVHVTPSKYSGATGLRIYVTPQPHRHTTGYVDERIDSFLNSYREKLGNYELLVKENGGNPICTLEEHQLICEMYDKYLLPNETDFRKLSIQVVGNSDEQKENADPKGPVGLVNKIRKVAKVKIDKKLPGQAVPSSAVAIGFDVPSCCQGKNGYFITDLDAFKNSLFCFPRQH